MDQIIDFFANLTNQEWIMAHGGMWIIALIVFVETGLFIGFLLPGDYLIFVTGLLLNGYTEPFDNHVANFFVWTSIISLAAILGYFTGYLFGYKYGYRLYNRKDTWYLKTKHLIKAQDFYDKKGGVAIIISRFLPILRTFSPIIAGIVKMDFKKFVFYNIIGAIVWIYGLATLGFLLGTNQWVKNNLKIIILLIILVTTGPVLLRILLGNKSKRNLT